MRTTFADPERIRKAVLRAQDTFDGTIEGWWRGKYKRSAAPWGDRTRGDLIEEYYWDLVLKKEELEERWKAGGEPELAVRLTKIDAVLAGKDVESGKTGDSWFDDWDGKEDDTPVDIDDVEPDDWKDISYD